MADAILYIIPETHTNKDHQARKTALGYLASVGAIVQLLENVCANDLSGAGSNLYGIEDEAAIRRANVILHHLRNIQKLMTVLGQPGVLSSQEREQHNQAMFDEVASLPRPKTRVTKELKDYITLFPLLLEQATQDKYFFFKRNHHMATHIKERLESLLVEENKPRVFALSVGSTHVDGSLLSISDSKYEPRRDLRTLLGPSLHLGGKTVEVVYGHTSAIDIAKKALEMCDNLPGMARWAVKTRLTLYIKTGIEL